MSLGWFCPKKRKSDRNARSSLQIAVQAAFPGKSLEDFSKQLHSMDVKLESAAFDDSRVRVISYGPNTSVEMINSEVFEELVAVRSVSTYPRKDPRESVGVNKKSSPADEEKQSLRMLEEENPPAVPKLGDPIADYYAIEVFKQFAIACVADGCGWGFGSQQAAENACKTFISHIKEAGKRGELRTTKEIGIHLLYGIDAANDEVVEQGVSNHHVGTTTLLGGVLVKGDSDKWLFVCANLGDCKAFLWHHQQNRIEDLTSSNRLESKGSSDPGGRLGPELDVRNLSVGCHECRTGDILFLVSDGIHDNFEPKAHGLNPSDIDPSLEVDWDSLSPERHTEIINMWRERKMMETIEEYNSNKSLLSITNALVDACVLLTKASREWLEDEVNSNKKLPEDYKTFPGKLDHTTCLALRVGN